MNLFKIPDKSNFVNEVSNYILTTFGNDLSNLKVILPSGYLCSHLQEFLTAEIGTLILPTIIPISELIAESEEAFKIPSSQIGTISRIEEHIILAGIVNSYNILGYDIIQSLRLSPQLASLFYEMEANEIAISQLKDLPTIGQSLHWQSIYEFLIFANNNWQSELRKIGKLSKAAYMQIMFDAEISRVKNNSESHLLIAGVAPYDLQTQKFIKQVTELQNGHLILPPTGGIDPKCQISPSEALFNINRLMSFINPAISGYKTLGQQQISLIDNLLGKKEQEKLALNSDNLNLNNLINYIEFDSILDEAAYLASYVDGCIAKDKKSKIAIILNNSKTKDIYVNFLNKYSINHHDLIGIDLLQTNELSLILSVAEIICAEFSLKKLFNLLSDPLINEPLTNRSITIKIKNLLLKKNRFAKNIADVIKTINDSEDQELKDWILWFDSTLISFPNDQIKGDQHTFSQLLLEVILITEKLCPTIWQTSLQPRLSEAISEILEQNWQFKLKNKEDFVEILQGIIGGGRIFPKTTDSNVLLCRASDVSMINFDHVIIADFSDGHYPATIRSSPWMNRQMQEELGLRLQLAIYGNSLYEFYLLLNNPDILITRSKKQISGKALAKSDFLLRLEVILGDRLHKSIYKAKDIPVIPFPRLNLTNDKEFIIANFFPPRISATDIETLIRTPYNFYAKKILKLRKENKLEEDPSLAEFGNFFHKVADIYTKNYNRKEKDKVFVFTEIGENVLDQSIFPDHSKNYWQTKLAAIAHDFIDFDEERRKKATDTYTEVRGSITLNLLGREIEIIAIADRIEITKSGKSVILDYKTGAVPTKKDVFSGLSPQMIIEALIMMENGFGLGCYPTELLIYVKIANSKPYIDITEIDLSKTDLLQHKKGLIELLEYYLSEKKFYIKPNMMKYDDYNHLSRR
jgi:ATP-dependent helicase/nuclease subunit B